MGFRGERQSSDRGVTPVVGVVLMVGLTVVLASVVGAMTFGMADEELQQPAPTVGVSFQYEESTNTVTVRHEEGPPLERSNLAVVHGGTTTALSGGAVAAGDTVTSLSYTPGERILLVWERPGGGSSTVIAASTAPG